MKVIVIGGVAGGASAAARIRRLDEKAEIIVFERGEHVSYSNCCLPYYLSGTVARSESLVLMTPSKFKKQHNIDVRINSEVTAINRAEKTITVKNTATGEEYKETYDKLVLSPGALPIRPGSIQGIDKRHVFTVRNVTDISRLKNYIDENSVENIAVIGGGFIGVEVAENLCNAGKNVSLVEGTNQIMAPFDFDMVQTLHKEMMDHGIDMHLSSTLTSIEDHTITVSKENEAVKIKADAVVMAIGVTPETKLAADAGIEIGETRGILVNHNYQTNDPDIYAVGDAIESFNRLMHTKGRLALAGPAQRQARAAADHMYGIQDDNKGFIGSSCVRIFEQNAACTGLNEKSAKKAGIPFDSVIVYPFDKVSLMPGKEYMGFKLVFEVPTGRILGAQAIGKGNVDKRIDVIAAMITMGATLEDLKELELCYSPVFGTAKDVVNIAALVGLNILNGVYKQLPLTEVRRLVETNAYIVDVREEVEYKAGHIINAHNIPLTQLRERLDEIPHDVPVYVHCRTSQRSYYATRCLQQNGFTNITNISGSYLAISLYEYFNDKMEHRTPILTAYNFK